MANYRKIRGYNIRFDQKLEVEGPKIKDEDLMEFLELIQNEESAGFRPGIMGFIERYPENSKFKVILYHNLEMNDELEKAEEVLKDACLKHSDDIECNSLMAEHILHYSSGDVRRYIGDNFKIADRFPRDWYYVDDFLAYQRAVFEYHIYELNDDEAEKILDLMKEVDEDHRLTVFCADEFEDKDMNVDFDDMPLPDDFDPVDDDLEYNKLNNPNNFDYTIMDADSYDTPYNNILNVEVTKKKK